MIRTTLGVLAILIATSLLAPEQSQARGDHHHNQADVCRGLRLKAMQTGDDYWWYRFYSCMRGGW